MKTYRYTAWSSAELKESATWSNIIKYAIKMAKINPSLVIEIRDNNLPYHLGPLESFIWCNDKKDIIPHYGK